MRGLIPMAMLAFLATACGGGREPRTTRQAIVPTVAETKSTQKADPAVGKADHDPRQVVERAAQVHGGPTRLAKLAQCVRAEKGEVSSGGASVRATRELAMALPGRCRLIFELDAGDGSQPQKITVAVDGDKGWRAFAGQVVDLTKDEADDLRGEAHLNWLRTILPLAGNRVELSALPAIAVQDQVALGVKVASKEHADVELYFDRQTGYLVKAVRPGNEAGTPVKREYYFSDFKELGGVTLPTRQVDHINGRKVAEWTVTDCKPVDSLPEGAFAKP